MYDIVLTIQLAALLAVSLLFGLWRERSRAACIAGLLLITPVPIVRLTAGVGGFVYLGDLVALVCATQLIRSSARRGLLNSSVVQLKWLVLILCFVSPLVGFILSTLSGVIGDIRGVALGLVRGLLYLSIFWYCAASLNLEWRVVTKVLRAQIALLTFFCLVGVGQYFGGYNVDYWNDVRDLEGVLSEDGYGGGFMGLYRGAVGAWVALSLSTAAVAFLSENNKYGQQYVYFGICFFISLAGTLIVGSRQGLFFGLTGGLLGSAMLYLHSNSRSIKNAVIAGNLTAVMLVLFGAFLFLIMMGDSELLDWFFVRFGSLLGDADLVGEVANRDPRFGMIIQRIFDSPLLYVFGVGEVSMDGGGSDAWFVYVDSEFLWAFQKIGIVGIILYLYFYTKFAFLLLGSKLGKSESYDGNKRALVLGMPVLIVCLFLIYGHYSLLHVQSSQAPIAYCAWSILGVSLSLRSNRDAGFKRG